MKAALERLEGVERVVVSLGQEMAYVELCAPLRTEDQEALATTVEAMVMAKPLRRALAALGRISE